MLTNEQKRAMVGKSYGVAAKEATVDLASFHVLMTEMEDWMRNGYMQLSKKGIILG